MAKKGMRPSVYRQVFGEQSPLQKLVNLTVLDIKERAKGNQEIKIIESQNPVVARWSASGIIISERK